MNFIKRLTGASTGLWLGLSVVSLFAQDWPQWLGPGRDAKTTLTAPEAWPESLQKHWTVEIGDGVATPALVGDRLFVFARQGEYEVIRCLNAESGDEIWKDQYPAEAASGPAAGFPGPRSSPAVLDGKLVTLGVSGILSCYNAESGDLLWRNEDHVGRAQIPRFSTSSSPILVDGLCISQFGSEDQGGVVAHDLTSGNEQWKWSDGSTSYGSLALLEIEGTRAILAPTTSQLVALDAATGNVLGEMELAQGRYNAATPIVDGQTIVVGGPNRGMTGVEVELAGGKITTREAWRNEDETTNTQYNSPIARDGLVFGLSAANQLFCINTKTSELAWQEQVGPAVPAGPPGGGRPGFDRGNRPPGPPPGGGDAEKGNPGERPQNPGGRRGGGRRGGGGRGGYGAVVDAGSVLLCLTPGGELRIFEPSGEQYRELARYQVAEAGTYAYPVATGNRIFVKDQNSITLWTIVGH